MESGGMIGEIDIAGIFISPLLLCLLVAFFARLVVSALLDALGFYRIVWQRPLFDLALFFLLVWLAFAGLRLPTTCPMTLPRASLIRRVKYSLSLGPAALAALVLGPPGN